MVLQGLIQQLVAREVKKCLVELFTEGATEAVAAVAGEVHGGLGKFLETASTALGVNKAKDVAEALAAQPRRKPNHKKQLCPYPGCKNAAAPVFGMVCAKHKDVPKTEIAIYRAQRRGDLSPAEAKAKLAALKAPKKAKVAKKKAAPKPAPKPAKKRSHKKKPAPLAPVPNPAKEGFEVPAE